MKDILASIGIVGITVGLYFLIAYFWKFCKDCKKASNKILDMDSRLDSFWESLLNVKTESEDFRKECDNTLSDLYRDLDDLRNEVDRLTKQQPNGPYLFGQEPQIVLTRSDTKLTNSEKL